MPRRVSPACGHLTSRRRGPCAACSSRAEAARPSATVRGYDAGWRRTRASFLARHPTCECPALPGCSHEPGGCPDRPTEVDHVIAKRDGGSDRDDNLRSMSKSCHSRRTAIDQSGWGPADGQGGARQMGGAHQVESGAVRSSPEQGGGVPTDPNVPSERPRPLIACTGAKLGLPLAARERSGAPTDSGAGPHRPKLRTGGPVVGGDVYLVGEGPEWFVPDRDGWIR